MALRWFRAAALAGTIAVAGHASAASFPPHLRFQTFDTAQVRVHYHQGLEPLARRAAALCDELVRGYEQRYGYKVPKIDVVLADVEDEPNGFATPLPFPLVHVRVVAPDGSEELGNQEDWLRLVLTHELAHAIHLERGRALVGVGRALFGRAPMLFPNALSPDWLVEGLATSEETRQTSFGRARLPDSRMVLRMAALEGPFPREDEPMTGLDRWPGGQAAYLFGGDYMSWLEEKFGPTVFPQLASVHGGRPLPFLDDWTARKVTGATHHTRWRQWRDERVAQFAAEASAIRERGLTTSTALTTRGVRQARPRYAPDGAWIAYTSRELTRPRTIRLMKPDGSGDHVLVTRDSGTTLSWTPDGTSIVYDRLERFATFQTRWDLFRVDVATRRVTRLTRGMRARDPDVSPDGATLVFVRQHAHGSELQTMPIAGGPARHLAGVSGEQWSDPRFSPDGHTVAAGRWRPGGELDVVLVDAATGEITALTEDRAKDVEPTFTRDGTHVIFRSDRDGVSNLYALRLADRALLRLTNVLGGAFLPEVSPDGSTLAFASYSSRGYDVHAMPLDLAAASPAPAFEDTYPPAHPEVAGIETDPHGYAAWKRALPRFWLPVVEDGSETRIGVATAGGDPLFRHLYGITVHRGQDTGRIGGQAYYEYDRFRPTITLTFEQLYGPAEGGTNRNREGGLQLSLPLRRRVRSDMSLALTFHRQREGRLGDPERTRDLGGIDATWRLDTTSQEPWSVSPNGGWRLRASALREAPGFGSEHRLWKTIGDVRRYQRLGGNGTLALRLGAGTTIGEDALEESYVVGGFPEATLLDVVRTNHAVLRGYDDEVAAGRHYLAANAELRLPLLHPQRGLGLLPLFLRHIHGTLFADAAHAWSGKLQAEDVRTSVGAALGADVVVAHNLPLTATWGVAQPLRTGSKAQAYFRLGLAF